MSESQLVRAADVTGAATSVAYYVLITSMFVLRITGNMQVARWVGISSFLAIVPIAFLVAAAFRSHRPAMYFLWLGLMAVFLVFELVADDILGVDFRSRTWSTILYVVFFFAATGGMMGVAAQAGKAWTWVAGLMFIIMAVMAFVQRARTGM